MYYVDENIKNTTRVFPDQGRKGYLRLDMNENPVGLPEDVVAKIREAVTPEFLATYPEPGRVTELYADFIGVNPDQICLTNGSDNAIRYVLQTFGEKGKDVVTVYPTFEMYMVNCWLLGLNHKTVPYKEDYSLDVDGLVAAIDDDTRIVGLVNPNNPMGNAYSDEDARRIVETAAAHNAIVVIDEAYHYFTDKSQLKLVNEYDNVIVLRTFSKAFSLAGVRLGAAISNPKIAHYLNTIRMTFEVNVLALKAAEVVLSDKGIIERLAATQIEGRTYLVSALEEAGYEVLPSESNFISFRPKTAAEQVAAKLAEKKILVKTFGGGPLKGMIRVNTAAKDVLERFVDELFQADR